MYTLRGLYKSYVASMSYIYLTAINQNRNNIINYNINVNRIIIPIFASENRQLFKTMHDRKMIKDFHHTITTCI